jgi:hypothetical protein
MPVAFIDHFFKYFFAHVTFFTRHQLLPAKDAIEIAMIGELDIHQEREIRQRRPSLQYTLKARAVIDASEYILSF